MSLGLLPIKWDKGLNKDLLPSELPDGFCSDAANVRFRRGFAEKIGGVKDAASLLCAAPAINPEWMQIVASSQSSSGRFLVYANRQKVYADNLNLTKTEITRYTEGVAVSSATAVGTTATVTTSVAHGRTTGDQISLWGFVPAEYNTTAAVTVTGATTYTYTTPSAPGGAATTIGLYSYNVTSIFNNFTERDWSGGVLNGVPFFNAVGVGLYYWNSDVTTRVRKFPSSYVADVARPFKNYIVQLAPTMNGTKYPHRVLWSAAADPGSIPSSFTASSTNDAGLVDLAETSGSCIDCCTWGDVNIIYKEDGRFGMQYIGGNDVFRFYRLPGNDGILNKGCVVNTPKGQVFFTSNYDVMIHRGGEAQSIAQDRVRSVLSLAAGAQTFCFMEVNPQANEVWVFLGNGTNGCDSALVWNWDQDTWGTKTLATIKSACSGITNTTLLSGQYMIVGAYVSASNKLGVVDGGAALDFGSSFTSYVERQGITGGDTDSMKFIQRSRHHIDIPAGETSLSMSIYHGSAKTADGAPTYASAATYTPGTSNMVPYRAVGGRFLALKATIPQTVSGNGTPKLRTSELEYSKGGRR